MRIDESHRPWAAAFVTILAIATICYVPYALFYPGGSGGNTVPGLIYGIAGYGMMLFAGLLGARKKVPLWRIGRAKIWMRGHVWLGALSLPMILFHSGFHARGQLTFVMVILLYMVVFSGIAGAILQHYLPRRMTAEVQLETIYEQIPEVREQLREEAAAILEKLCAEPAVASVAGTSAESGRSFGNESEEEPALDLTPEQRINLRDVYWSGIVPFLRGPESGVSPLSDGGKSRVFFKALRTQFPASIHEFLNDLESICDEERQLSRQRRMYLLLHGWLLVHVPLSITLLVLGAIHAAVAIRY